MKTGMLWVQFFVTWFQVDFVKHVDESVKKVIRLLKKWKQVSLH